MHHLTRGLTFKWLSLSRGEYLLKHISRKNKMENEGRRILCELRWTLNLGGIIQTFLCLLCKLQWFFQSLELPLNLRGAENISLSPSDDSRAPRRESGRLRLIFAIVMIYHFYTLGGDFSETGGRADVSCFETVQQTHSSTQSPVTKRVANSERGPGANPVIIRRGGWFDSDVKTRRTDDSTRAVNCREAATTAPCSTENLCLWPWLFLFCRCFHWKGKSAAYFWAELYGSRNAESCKNASNRVSGLGSQKRHCL